MISRKDAKNAKTQRRVKCFDPVLCFDPVRVFDPPLCLCVLCAFAWKLT
jgi:hypothetical protein